MNLSKKIVNLRGEEIPKTFPSREEVNNLPKLSNGQPNQDLLERETIRNIILNCLINYVVEDKKEGWYINLIAQSLISDKKEIDFKDKIMKFLIDVLDNQTMRREMVKDKDDKEKEEIKGLYAGWVIAQVKQELGIKEEEL